MIKNLGFEPASLDKRFFSFILDIVIKILIFILFMSIANVFIIQSTKNKFPKIIEYNEALNLKHPDYDSYIFINEELNNITENENAAQLLLIEANQLVEGSEDYLVKIEEYETKLITARNYCLDKEKSCNLTEDQIQNYGDYLSPIANDIFYANFIGTILPITITGFLYSFFLPLYLKNGQTIGRKTFKLALVNSKGGNVKPINLFIRVTSAIIIYFVFSLLSGQFLQIIGSILIGNSLLIIVTKNKLSFHDFLSNTIIVDTTKQTAINPEAKLDVV